MAVKRALAINDEKVTRFRDFDLALEIFMK